MYALLTMRNPCNPDADPPRGIGGWLILPALGLVISPLWIAYVLVTRHLPLFLDGRWARLATVGTHTYHPLLACEVVFEVVGNLTGLTLATVTLVFFLKRSRRAPMLMVALLSWGVVFSVTNHFFVNALSAGSPSWADAFRPIVAAAIWIPYFLESRRVKATFVR